MINISNIYLPILWEPEKRFKPYLGVKNLQASMKKGMKALHNVVAVFLFFYDLKENSKRLVKLQFQCIQELKLRLINHCRGASKGKMMKICDLIKHRDLLKNPEYHQSSQKNIN